MVLPKGDTMHQYFNLLLYLSVHVFLPHPTIEKYISIEQNKPHHHPREQISKIDTKYKFCRLHGLLRYQVAVMEGGQILILTSFLCSLGYNTKENWYKVTVGWSWPKNKSPVQKTKMDIQQSSKIKVRGSDQLLVLNSKSQEIECHPQQ